MIGFLTCTKPEFQEKEKKTIIKLAKESNSRYAQEFFDTDDNKTYKESLERKARKEEKLKKIAGTTEIVVEADEDVDQDNQNGIEI